MELEKKITYKDFTEMPVWRLGMEVAELIFAMSNELPKKEDYGLTSQIRRASVSISANIAEAFGRATSSDKNKFYDYARGSAFETKSLMLYGEKVGYFTEKSVSNIIEKLNEVVYSLNKVKTALTKPQIRPQFVPESQPQP